MNYSSKFNNINDFRVSEENIIETFTKNGNNIFLNKSRYTELSTGEEKAADVKCSNCDIFSSMDNKTKNLYLGGNDVLHEESFVKKLLQKIQILENEKKCLLKFLENKKNIELDYKKALETQTVFINSENKKTQFYENEWLEMKSIGYAYLNSGKEPLRQTLKQFYEDPNIYEKLGNLNAIQEMVIANLIEDHKNLIKERKEASKKYYEAVNANFQLYQQNEMLKAQNFNFIEKNKDLINEELEKKLIALNSSLIDVQKENIHLKELVDQYSRLIKNIENCSEINVVTEELDKFKSSLLI
ncbi:conserved Plasmodium protein, unknown function [Plasmodium berghei]|uniref:Uncharacterized protein n=2 Tax=Plasmodium berghei TaxID=5821 RepID=A0A509ADG2_PLABA|nr:conserved Plasmodium protein, unknown function [Plasmodium berghei ANKA]CXH95669.1 conserved Plasmodium protein, unknown function [Plasmodium berghei]SCL91046.1 conserved Plasmodium protein, unknown function [Plasmodium berghei]SCM15413.1 conserved Plasmodium protein, unknown function [Plasmodium berghei]SCM17208.1 conserved Plasmodium protein, unknown function [Plasmodium berghei]SCN22277.1 conserved Plasmodium protein, unknown function [Plasmodium berghei]|eukprot:XP_034419998.1 conserved Plasmodium protein, unknown function [Plasmodium berghei ANKA]